MEGKGKFNWILCMAMKIIMRILILSSCYQLLISSTWFSYLLFFSLEELEAASRESPEKIAILQISELTLACSISQMSTPQHVFLRNSPYILDTLTLQNTFRRLLLSDS